MILKETSDWLVLDKPSGLHSTHQNSCSGCAEEWLKEHFSASKQLFEGGLVHRLDQLTSGCLLAAKNKTTYHYFKNLFDKESCIKKIYFALIEGHSLKREFTLFFSSRYRSSKKVTVKETGTPRQRGYCKWSAENSSPHAELLRVELVGPGRRHQIRAGMAHLGHPLMGDELYGAERATFFGLHAYSLAWNETYIECPPPKGWPLQPTLSKQNP